MKLNSKKSLQTLFILFAHISFINCGSESTTPQYLPPTASTNVKNANTTTSVSSAVSSVSSQLNSLNKNSTTTDNALNVIQNYVYYSAIQIQSSLQDIYDAAPSINLNELVSALASVNIQVTAPSSSSANNLYSPLSYDFTVNGNSPNFTINILNLKENNNGIFPKWITSAGNTLQVGLKMTSPGTSATKPGTGFKFPFRCLLFNVIVYRTSINGAATIDMGKAGPTHKVLVSNTGSTITNTTDPCYIQNNGPVYTHPVLSSETTKDLITGTYPTVKVQAIASDNCQGLSRAGCPVDTIYPSYQFAATIDVAYSGTKTLVQY